MQDFDFATVVVDDRLPSTELVYQLEQELPQAIVVMGNPALAQYRRHAEGCPPGRPAPPAVVVMTSFLEAMPDLRNSTGIAYEVPGVSAFVQLRSAIARPLRRVAVLHRPGFQAFIERQAQLAGKEQIALAALPVSDDPSAAEIRTALRRAAEVAQADALWVLNDDGLLRDAEFLEEAWRPELARLEIPVLVGLPALASAEARFGSFAVVPDHEALGVQAAQLVSKLAETGWRADRHPIEPPISTVTIADLPLLQRRFGLRPGAAERVDRAVE